MIEKDSRPSWFDPATADDPSEVAAIQHGGCGSWNGFGVTIRRGNWNVGLSHSKYSSRHIAQMILMASSHSARLASRSTWNAVCSIGVDRPVPHSIRPCDRMSAVATFSATRVGWVKPYGSSVTPKPRRMFSRRLRQRADHDLGGRTVRAALAEVVLDEPGDVEAELVGEPHLLEHLAVGPLLARSLAVGVRSLVPRPRRSRSRTAGPASRTQPPVPVSSHIG